MFFIKKISPLFLFVLLFTSCAPGELIDEAKSKSYYYLAGRIFYSPGGNWFEIGIEKCEADKATFQVLSNHIAKDKNYIFYSGIRQEQVDYESFYIDRGVAKDKFYAYIQSFQELEPIAGVDAASFEYLDIDTVNRTWSRDKNHYYLNHNKLQVDRDSFVFLNDRFSQDKDSIYADFNSSYFAAVKPNSGNIEVINEEYIRDSNQLYYVATFRYVALLTHSFQSFDTVRIVDRDVICVNDKVLYYGNVFKYKEVDAASFELYFPNRVSGYAKDKNKVYYREEVIEEADPRTYVPLELGFGKDARHVFHETKLLKGADPKSFREVGRFGVEYQDDLGNKFDWEGNRL